MLLVHALRLHAVDHLVVRRLIGQVVPRIDHLWVVAITMLVLLLLLVVLDDLRRLTMDGISRGTFW